MPIMGSDIILRTRGLTKRYGTTTVVDNLNLELRGGEVFGLLGPNGSGKSTTVSMILGLVQPTSGDIEAFGMPLRGKRWEILRQIGAIIESPAFYPYLSGRDNLAIYRRALGDIGETAIDDVLERVGLAERGSDLYREYSLGMKQRLGIASTLLRDPHLVILDEPTNGLDPAGTREVRDLIPRLASEGRTVLVSSHLLHEVEQVCDRVAILQRGIMLAEGPVADLLGVYNAIRIRVGADGERETTLATLRTMPWVTDARIDDDYIVALAPITRAGDINRALVAQGIFAAELTPVRPTLEAVFLDLTGEGEPHGDR